MPYRNLSLDDFARYIGMDAREVRRLADRGKLPGQKIGGEWRFNRAKVTEWLQQEMPHLGVDQLASLERSMESTEHYPHAPGGMVITGLIGLEGVDAEMAANTRGSVLRELVGLAQRTGLLYDAEGLLDALQQRESMCSTALPNHVAIPHPRQPMPYVSAEPFICVARLPHPIAFGSAYREYTQLFFLVCCHDPPHHLRVLARLVRLLQPQTIQELLEIESRELLLQKLIEAECGLTEE